MNFKSATPSSSVLNSLYLEISFVLLIVFVLIEQITFCSLVEEVETNAILPPLHHIVVEGG